MARGGRGNSGTKTLEHSFSARRGSAIRDFACNFEVLGVTRHERGEIDRAAEQQILDVPGLVDTRVLNRRNDRERSREERGGVPRNGVVEGAVAVLVNGEHRHVSGAVEVDDRASVLAESNARPGPRVELALLGRREDEQVGDTARAAAQRDAIPPGFRSCEKREFARSEVIEVRERQLAPPVGGGAGDVERLTASPARNFDVAARSGARHKRHRRGSRYRGGRRSEALEGRRHARSRGLGAEDLSQGVAEERPATGDPPQLIPRPLTVRRARPEDRELGQGIERGLPERDVASGLGELEDALIDHFTADLRAIGAQRCRRGRQ